MTEYVTKEQVKEEILSWARCINNPERLVTEDALYVIDALPSADVRPVVRGKWILDSDPGEPWKYKCNQCGEVTNSTLLGEPRYNYCPMCGADMRGGDAE